MTIRIDTSVPGKPFLKPWKNAIAVGRAYELLRQDVLDHLRDVQRSIGYRYCRFHGLFHDEMGVVGRDAEGKLAFRWHQIDKIYDALLAMGLRPFVELNPMPSALASGTATFFDWKMNITPPRDFGEWEALVEAFARHLVDRYGLEEVAQWYFEVWNEPNLSGFWSGTKEEYWELYAASARGLKRVSPRLRVGGPASSKANWLGEMISHCTGAGLPLDFVSTHLYAQDEYVVYSGRAGSPYAPGRFFAETVREAEREVRQSARPDLEIHWTEWNSLAVLSQEAGVSWVHNPSVDSLFGAAFVCDACIELDDACTTFCWWTASDIFEECGMPQSEFSCTYGLVTINGLRKATFHAFDFLNRLRGDRLGGSVESGSLPAGCGWAAVREGDVVRVLLWHRMIPENAQETWRGSLALPTFAVGNHLLLESRIKAESGSAWETWKRMGSPQTLSPSEMRLLRAHSEPAQRLHLLPNLKTEAAWDFALEPGEVCLLELRPQGSPALPKTRLRHDLEQWEKEMSGLSR